MIVCSKKEQTYPTSYKTLNPIYNIPLNLPMQFRAIELQNETWRAHDARHLLAVANRIGAFWAILGLLPFHNCWYCFCQVWPFLHRIVDVALTAYANNIP